MLNSSTFKPSPQAHDLSTCFGRICPVSLHNCSILCLAHCRLCSSPAFSSCQQWKVSCWCSSWFSTSRTLSSSPWGTWCGRSSPAQPSCPRGWGRARSIGGSCRRSGWTSGRCRAGLGQSCRHYSWLPFKYKSKKIYKETPWSHSLWYNLTCLEWLSELIIPRAIFTSSGQWVTAPSRSRGCLGWTPLISPWRPLWSRWGRDEPDGVLNVS